MAVSCSIDESISWSLLIDWFCVLTGEKSCSPTPTVSSRRDFLSRSLLAAVKIPGSIILCRFSTGHANVWVIGLPAWRCVHCSSSYCGISSLSLIPRWVWRVTSASWMLGCDPNLRSSYEFHWSITHCIDGRTTGTCLNFCTFRDTLF